MSIIEGRNAEILQSIIDGEPYENPNPYPSRIEQLLMELKEVIEQGGGGTVDQTYDATSENAQSGKAVAEALETIPSVTVDQTFDPTSANAQSGVAVASALTFKQVADPLTPNMTTYASQDFTNVTGGFEEGQLFVATATGDTGGLTPNTREYSFVIPAVTLPRITKYPVFYRGTYCCDVSFYISENILSLTIYDYVASTNFSFSNFKIYAIG